MDILIYSYAAVAAIIATALTWMIIKYRKKSDTYSHLIQNNTNQKRVIPIPLGILLFSVLWPLAVAGVVVYVLLGFDRRTERNPAFDKKLYGKLSRKRAKEALKNLRGKAAEDLEIHDLRSGLRSLIQNELLEYRLDAFSHALSESDDDSDFGVTYEIFLDRISQEAKERYEELKRNGPPGVFYSVSVDPFSTWSVVMTRQFEKSLRKLDAMAKDRITDAIKRISLNPRDLHGNTVKPLKHDSKNCWRYRIGGYRLIYMPDPENKKIVLLCYSNRSEAYS